MAGLCAGLHRFVGKCPIWLCSFGRIVLSLLQCSVCGHRRTVGLGGVSAVLGQGGTGGTRSGGLSRCLELVVVGTMFVYSHSSDGLCVYFC